MAFTAAAASLLLVATACGSSSKKSASGSIPAGPIKLGALLTLNGPLAAIGTAQKTNDETLIALVNQKGGIAGHQVQLVELNDQGDPATAVSDAQQLVSDHVAGVIYAGTSLTVTQTVPVFMKGKVPVVMLDPLDQWADGNKYPYFFDNYPLNQPTTNVMASFAKNTLHATKLGVITDGSTFGDTLQSDLKKSVGGPGDQIVASVSYQPTAADVTTQVRQVKDAGAQAIVLLAAAGMGHVYDAMRTLGWSVPIITTAASFFDGYTSLQNLATNTYSNCAVALKKGSQPDANTNAVLGAATAHARVTPSVGQLVLTYDDVQILKAAIEKTNSLDPDKIKNAIQGFHDRSFTSPSITYSFSSSNHGGWPQSEIHMCPMSPLGPFDLPFIAS